MRGGGLAAVTLALPLALTGCTDPGTETTVVGGIEITTPAPKTAKTVKGMTPASNEPTWLESIFFGKETP